MKLDTVIATGSAVDIGLADIHTVYLRGGVYSGEYINTLARSANKVITFISYPGEWAIVDGDFSDLGEYCIFRNIEFTDTSWETRVSEQAGSDPSDIPIAKMTMRAVGAKYINCIIHDKRSPLFDLEGSNAFVYGCLFYNNGWIAPDRPHGHGIYIQNYVPTKIIRDCITFNNYRNGINAYGPTGDYCSNIIIDGVTCFMNGHLGDDPAHGINVGAESGVSDGCELTNNMTYNNDEGINFYGGGATNVVLTNNYCPDGIAGSHEDEENSGNYSGPGTGNETFLRVNEYDSGRANLTIYNQAEESAIVVSLDQMPGVYAGDTMMARNVQDYFVDIQTLVVGMDKTITINMQSENRTVSAPHSGVALTTTFPQFGCFVLERA